MQQVSKNLSSYLPLLPIFSVKMLNDRFLANWMVIDILLLVCLLLLLKHLQSAKERFIAHIINIIV